MFSVALPGLASFWRFRWNFEVSGQCRSITLIPRALQGRAQSGKNPDGGKLRSTFDLLEIAALAAGDSQEMIVEDYPGLTKADLAAALESASQMTGYQELAYHAAA